MSLTEIDYELLSAYIDDALAPDEREALEARLASEPDLRTELEALRQVVSLVNNLPVLKAPRSFTLTAEMIDPQPERREGAQKMPRVIEFTSTTSARRRNPLRWLSVAASMLVVFVLVMALLAPYLNGGSTGTTDGAGSVAFAATATMAPTSQPESTQAMESAPALEMDTTTLGGAGESVEEEAAADLAEPPTVMDTFNAEEAASEEAASGDEFSTEMQALEPASTTEFETEETGLADLTAEASTFMFSTTDDLDMGETANDADPATDLEMPEIMAAPESDGNDTFNDASEDASGDMPDDSALRAVPQEDSTLKQDPASIITEVLSAPVRLLGLLIGILIALLALIF